MSTATVQHSDQQHTVDMPAAQVLARDALLLLLTGADGFCRDGLEAHWTVDAVDRHGGREAVRRALSALGVEI